MSPTIRWFWLAARSAAINGVFAGLLAAQDAPVLRVGARVRVTLEGVSALRLVGALEALTEDTLHLRIRRESFGRPSAFEYCAIPLGGISAVEISRGAQGHALRGAGYGGLLGAVFGVAAGLASRDEIRMSAGERALAGGVSFGVFGAGVGALVGAASRSEAWEPVPLTRLPRVRPIVTRDQVGVSVRF